MNKNRKITVALCSLLLIISSCFFTACTKYGDGFLSPSMQYAVNEFTIVKGRIAKSYSLITDGSSSPMHVKWMHIYDAAGKIVDSLFSKKYVVPVWTESYNPLTDTNYARIIAKRSTAALPPIIVNESNGTIETNSATIYLPTGSYTMDLEVTNAAGTQQLKNIMKMNLVDGQTIEIAPETGAFSLSLLIAGTASGPGAAAGNNGGTLFNGANNPFVEYTVTRFADTPNVFIYKIMDRNGVAFNPKNGEIAKRPNTGLNPTPPFLQNLQDYAPDTFTADDTAISLKYPLVPFPIASLGNGYNMYYRIPAQFITIDSTTLWSSNTAGSFYKGPADSHYKGVYTAGKYDFAFRTPMRIQVPGAYLLKVKLLNAARRQ
ncbi:MAG: hypothetical protein V4722_12845 [Bacteroidota bacterium]